MDVVPERPKAGVEVAEALLADREQRRRLWAYARGKFGIADEDVEDLLQETAMQVMRAAGPIRRPEGFVFEVFHAHCYRELKGRSTRPAEVALAEGHRTAIPSAPEGPPREDLLALRQGLSRISPRCRKLLRAHYLEGKTFRELVDEMAIASGSIWFIINRCLRRLKRCLEP
jgi:RNA polymerase sigma factor (sigma-70 family)